MSKAVFHLTLVKDACVPISEDQTILAAALEAGVPLMHVCGGKAKCSTCRVLIVEGEENLLPATEKEQKLSRLASLPSKVRLACQTCVKGPVTIRRIMQDESDVGLYVREDSGFIEETGEEKELVLFFLDIRNFTNFVENHLAFDVIHIIRKLFAAFEKIIETNGGRIIETTGDGLYAVFDCRAGRVAAAHNGLQSAYSIFSDLKGLNENYFEKYFDQKLQVGIGLHIGNVVSGTIVIGGMPHNVVMGFPVNVTARLESATKELNNSLIVSEEVHKLLIIPEKASVSQRIHVKGVTGELNVFLMGEKLETNHVK